ncbi:AP2 domain-containing protein [Lacticaseibacillus paracasei]|uniref:AP2 domain-containing protein n=1 Tax=Lacticaseibacillus paracasei TaxID=1597 RepID=UPI00019C9909|nr:AP2 domain-containing protein [Lacticaseibacillus paracasei]EEI67799.1 AP2 domain protein [Lacticaseibacillus paracasei subsp. paracasei ATCC 25302 = DSM 5622 = JCM 8130]MBA4475139.1 AP2 domain-containing protein [Lacticaseibacillus paracasei]TDG88572.1 hypothetical protein C5L26_002960 [Lacticaseibacillus paracasei subsp. paracasei]GEL31914.1 hypothetical protein LPA04_23750 [Lacticaseibacillus paracasei subsp. paracasei]
MKRPGAYRAKNHDGEVYDNFTIIGDTGKRDNKRGQIVLIQYNDGVLDEIPYSWIRQGHFTGLDSAGLSVNIRRQQGKTLGKKYRPMLQKYSRENGKKLARYFYQNFVKDGVNLALTASRTIRSDSSSGVKGVSWNNKQKKWCATLTVGGKRVLYKYFEHLSDAVEARKAAEDEYLKPYIKQYQQIIGGN